MRQPRINLLDHEDAAKWQMVIDQSRLFACLYTPVTATSATQAAQLAYAIAQGKPICVLVEAGCRLPEDYGAGASDLRVYHWSTIEELGDIVHTLTEEMRDVGKGQ